MTRAISAFRLTITVLGVGCALLSFGALSAQAAAPSIDVWSPTQGQAIPPGNSLLIFETDDPNYQAQFKFSVAGASDQSCSRLGSSVYCGLPSLEAGEYEVSLIGTRNGETTTATHLITVSSTASPAINFRSPLEGASYTDSSLYPKVGLIGYTAAECSYDAEPFTGCAFPWGPETYFVSTSRDLTNGQHSFSVRATRSDGQIDQVTKTFSVSDTTPPAFSIHSPTPDAVVSSGYVSVYWNINNWSPTGVSSTRCRLSGGDWKPCGRVANYFSNWELFTLVNGEYLLEIELSDSSGNASTRAVAFTVEDNSGPDIETVGIDEGQVVNDGHSVPYWLVDGMYNAPIECRFDDESWQECDERIESMGINLGNGSHRWDLRSTDPMGRTATLSRTFSVADTIAPYVYAYVPDSGNGTISNSSFTLNLSTDRFSRRDCRVDYGAWVDCPDYEMPVSVTYNGSHRLEVRAFDIAGNVGSYALNVNVQDTTAPDLNVVSPTPTAHIGEGESLKVEFSLDGARGRSVLCRIDQQPEFACQDGEAIPVDAGTHQLRLRAIDAVQNETIRTINITADGEPAVDIFIDQPRHRSTLIDTPLGSPYFTGSESWSSTKTCTVDGLPLGDSCSSNFVWETLANGPHVLRLVATNNNGQRTVRESQFSILDTTTDSVTIHYPTPNQVVTDSSAAFGFSPGSGWTGWSCRVDSRPWRQCYSSFAPKQLANGQHTFEVAKVDNGGRQIAASVNFTVADVTPPQISITSPIDGSVFPTYSSVQVSTSPSPWSGNFFDTCYVDGKRTNYMFDGVLQSCSSPYHWIDEPGEHVFRIVRRDPAGNTASDSVSLQFTGDGSPDPDPAPDPPPPPTGASTELVVSEPLPGATVPVSPMVRYSTNRDAVSRLRGWIDDGPKQRLRISSTGWRVPAMPEGPHTINVDATAESGQIQTVSIPVIVEDSEPTLVEITSPQNQAVVTQSPVRIRFSTGSDVVLAECRANGGPWTECSPFYSYYPSGLGNGTHTVDVRVTDFGDHTSTASVSFTIADVEAPSFDISAPYVGEIVRSSKRLSLAIPGGERNATIRCWVNGVEIGIQDGGSCTKSELLTGMQAGTNELTVTLSDGVGNVATRTVYFVAETSLPPLLRLMLPLEGATFNDSSAAVGYWIARSRDAMGDLGSNELQVECNVDGAGWSLTCPSEVALGGPGLPYTRYRSLAATNGSHSIAIRIVDFLGNSVAAAANYEVDDNTPPAAYLDEPAQGAVYDSSDVPISLEVSGAVKVECALDSEPVFQPCASGLNVGSWALSGPPASGEHELRLRVIDPAGNSSSFTRQFTVNSNDASVTFTGGPVSITNDSSPSFAVAVEPVEASIECRIDGGGWAMAVEGTFNAPQLSDGVHSIACRGVIDGLPSAAFTVRSFTVDTVPPETTITSKPGTYSNDPTVNVSLTSNEVSTTFQCRAGSSEWENVDSTGELATLADGAHTIDCRARDAAGNVEPSPASFIVNLDTVVPVSTLSVSSLYTNNRRPPVTIQRSESNLTTVCRVANVTSFQNVTGNFTPPSLLADGPHTIQCQSTDRAGNVETPAATVNVVVDTVPPNTEITGAPPAITSTTSAALTVSSPDGDVIELRCNLNGGSYQATAGQYLLPSLGDRLHTVNCYARDRAGNNDPSAATVQFRVDTTPPTIGAIVPGAGAWTADPGIDASFTITDATPTTTTCALDAGSAVACGSPFDLGNLVDGTYQLKINALDQAGNSSMATVSFNVDTIPPTTTILTAPNSLSRDSTPTVVLSANEPSVTYQCQVDGGAWSSATSSTTFQPGTVGDGEHRIDCRARDRALNLEPSPVSTSFVIDTIAPIVAFTTPAPGSLISDDVVTAQFSVQDANAVTSMCAVDATEPAECDESFTTAQLNDGVHAFTVRAEDAAGNVSSASVSFIVDTQPPDTSINSSLPRVTSSTTIALTVSSSEADSTIQCRIDDGGWTPISGQFVAPDLPDGAHEFECIATDAAGNVDMTPSSIQTIIDSTPPTISVSNPSAGGFVLTQRPSFNFSAIDANELMLVRCSVDGDSEVPCLSPWQPPRLSPGQHSLRIRAADTAGNERELTRSFSVVIVDNEAPETYLTGYPGPLTETAGPFTFESNEEVVDFECAFDAGNYSPCVSGFTGSPLTLGQHTFKVRARDELGNVDASPAARAFTIVPSAPTNHEPEAELDVEGSVGAAPMTSVITIGGTDQDDDELDFLLSFGDGSASIEGTLPAEPMQHVFTKPGIYRVRLQVRDGSSIASTSEEVIIVDSLELRPNAGDDVVVVEGDTVPFTGENSKPAELIDGYEWNFGDGEVASTSQTSHRFANAGIYTTTLTVRDGANSATDTVQVKVIPRRGSGLRLRVRDAQGTAVPGAIATITQPDGSQRKVSTGSNGSATFEAMDDGETSVYIAAEGYTPSVKQVTVVDGAGELDVGLSPGDVGAATLSSRPMTYDEILAAGIDPADPANSHVYEANIHLYFIVPGGESKSTYLHVGVGGRGLRCLSNCGNNPGQDLPQWSSGGTLTFGGYRFYPTVQYVAGEPIIQWLVLPMRASWLKQFFDVKLVIQNLTTGFDFEPGVAQLSMPEGLSLAATGSPQALAEEVPIVPAGESRTIDWVLRGDVEGFYDLEASYQSGLDPTGVPVRLLARTEEPVHVWGASAIDMEIAVSKFARRWGPYAFEVRVKNVSDVPIYNMQIEMLDKPDGRPNTEADFFYAPVPAQVQGTAEIPPGQTFKTRFVVYAGIGNSQVTEMMAWLPESFVERTGGDVDLNPRLVYLEDSETPAFAGPLVVDVVKTDGADRARLRWEKPVATPGKTVVGYELYSRQSLSGGKWSRNVESIPSNPIGGGVMPNEVEVYEIPSNLRDLGRYYGIATKFSDGSVAFLHDIGTGPSRYVALGDSFSSGEGVPAFEPGTAHDVTPDAGGEYDNQCHRSWQGSYSRRLVADAQLNAQLLPATYAACSGAITDDYWHGGKSENNDGEPAQREHLNDFTNVVSLSMGGNDIAFKDIAMVCSVTDCGALGDSSVAPVVSAQWLQLVSAAWNIRGLATSCVNPQAWLQKLNCAYKAKRMIQTALSPERTALPMYLVTGTLQNRLTSMYNDILAQAPNAQLFVMEYPDLAGVDEDAGSCELLPGSGIHLDSDERSALADVVSSLNWVVSEARRSTNDPERISIVDANGEFEGHSLCDGAELNQATYFNSLVNDVISTPGNYGKISYSYHPNADGQEAYARALRDAINNGVSGNVISLQPRETREAGSVFVPYGARKVRASSTWQGSTVKASLVSPNGTVYTEDSPGVVSGSTPTSHWLEVSDPEPGEWVAQVFGDDLPDGAEYVGVSAFATTDAERLAASTPTFEAVPGSPLEFDFAANGPDGASFRWSFSDGTTADGPNVRHAFLQGNGRWAILQTEFANGQVSRASVQIDDPVVDDTPPVFGDLPDVIEEATTPSGANVQFALPTADDDFDDEPSVSCEPSSGSAFGLGDTEVTCESFDASGNSSQKSFTVSVRDTTAPVFGDVDNIGPVSTSSSSGANIAFAQPTATDLVDGNVTSTCSPSPGSLFRVGSTTVTCTATDSQANSRAVSFTVLVVASPPPSGPDGGSTPPPSIPTAPNAPPPSINAAPKSVKSGKPITLEVTCAAGCELRLTLKLGRKIVKLKAVKVAAGATEVTVKLPNSVTKKIKAARKAKKSVKLTLMLSTGGGPENAKTVKIR